MDPGLVLVENFGWLVAVLGLIIAAPLFAWSGYLYMSSMGDPNRSASARNSIIGVCAGIIVIGCAFILPRAISEFVVEPAGGVVFEDRAGINCDGMLRDQLVINREASDARRVNFVVQRIQSRSRTAMTFSGPLLLWMIPWGQAPASTTWHGIPSPEWSFPGVFSGEVCSVRPCSTRGVTPGTTSSSTGGFRQPGLTAGFPPTVRSAGSTSAPSRPGVEAYR